VVANNDSVGRRALPTLCCLLCLLPVVLLAASHGRRPTQKVIGVGGGGWGWVGNNLACCRGLPSFFSLLCVLPVVIFQRLERSTGPHTAGWRGLEGVLGREGATFVVVQQGHPDASASRCVCFVLVVCNRWPTQKEGEGSVCVCVCGGGGGGGKPHCVSRLQGTPNPLPLAVLQFPASGEELGTPHSRIERDGGVVLQGRRQHVCLCSSGTLMP
jgi:hypothetical protein